MTSMLSPAATDAPQSQPIRSPRRNGMRAVIYREFLLLTRNRTNLLLAVLPTAIVIINPKTFRHAVEPAGAKMKCCASKQIPARSAPATSNFASVLIIAPVSSRPA